MRKIKNIVQHNVFIFLFLATFVSCLLYIELNSDGQLFFSDVNSIKLWSTAAEAYNRYMTPRSIPEDTTETLDDMQWIKSHFFLVWESGNEDEIIFVRELWVILEVPYRLINVMHLLYYHLLLLLNYIFPSIEMLMGLVCNVNKINRNFKKYILIKI